MPSARPATAAPRRNSRSQPVRPRSVTALRPPLLRVRWDRAGRVGLLVVLAIVVGLYVQHTLSYLSISAQTSEQQSIVQTLARQNAQLAAQQRALNDPNTIVSDARSLGMVRPNERAYVVVGHTGH